MAKFHVTIKNNETGEDHPEVAALLAMRAALEKEGGGDD